MSVSYEPPRAGSGPADKDDAIAEAATPPPPQLKVLTFDVQLKRCAEGVIRLAAP